MEVVSTNQWFRSWHGAPTDPKWLGIARKAGIAPGIVAALVWSLLDRASQSEDRGSIAGYDADGLGCFFGCEADQVEAVVQAMHDKGILTDNAFSGWSKHQPIRECNGLRPAAHVWRELRQEVFARDDYTCGYCGVRGTALECDHIIPVSRGGGNDPKNLTTACKPCNRSKRDKLVSEWMQ